MNTAQTEETPRKEIKQQIKRNKRFTSRKKFIFSQDILQEKSLNQNLKTHATVCFINGTVSLRSPLDFLV